MKLTMISVDSMESTGDSMTKVGDVLKRRAVEQSRIRVQLNSVRAEEEALLKGGEDTVAWVKEEQCIGCDQCTIVCEDDAIELYDTPLASPIMEVDVNKKARILRDPCTGCKICVLACPTDAIIMIDR
ncbi:MAG: 4Fe-4S binding protein [Candidatus Thalassarchaeaceae archaeon]|jgi:Pyruvate/2-oxoacid:ferredoxin oxidoreductase delta subunit|nr:4Fe-4S binding protein [Candidatus Thalassarchaeaceae archaeon]